MSKPVPARLDPREFVARLLPAAARAGLTATRFGAMPAGELHALTRPAAAERPRIYLSSGIHGDEPAPPEALLALIASGFCDERAHWFICPLLNPSGFVRGTRESAEGMDLNRDYKAPRSPEIQAHVAWLRTQPAFDLVLCAHEDWEAVGFYLYELNPNARPTLAPALLAGARAHCPIEGAALIDGRPIAAPGIIRPEADPALRETWPEAIFLREGHGDLIYTLETPSGLPLRDRVNAMAGAIRSGIERFLADFPPAATTSPRR